MWIVELRPDQDAFKEAVHLFDAYRVHYGETSDPDRVGSWLSEQLTSGRLNLAAAVTDTIRVAGLITSATHPASLRLDVFVHIQDLYVSPDSRRSGVATALLNHVLTRAKAAGALRVSLRTEEDNEAALALYRSAGFKPVAGLTALSHPLTDQP
jgi:ribosomal protein S18 acetylase RimI-like enzyme